VTPTPVPKTVTPTPVKKSVQNGQTVKVSLTSPSKVQSLLKNSGIKVTQSSSTDQKKVTVGK
jgi:hypothetical protein